MAGPFDDHLVGSRGRGARGGGGSVNANRNRGGGSGGGGNNHPNNRNKNKGGGGPIVPDLPVVNKDLGLHQVGTGQMGGAFALGAGTQFAPGAGSSGVGMGFSDKDDYERTYFKNNPQEGFRAFVGSAGLNANALAPDLFGQWLDRQYGRTEAEYNALRADNPNQDLSYLDYLSSLGGVPYGQPGWDASQKAYWQHLYAADTDENRGISRSPFQGTGRWLAF
jgi:hypothetical protein